MMASEEPTSICALVSVLVRSLLNVAYDCFSACSWLASPAKRSSSSSPRAMPRSSSLVYICAPSIRALIASRDERSCAHAPCQCCERASPSASPRRRGATNSLKLCRRGPRRPGSGVGPRYRPDDVKENPGVKDPGPDDSTGAGTHISGSTSMCDSRGATLLRGKRIGRAPSASASASVVRDMSVNGLERLASRLLLIGL